MTARARRLSIVLGLLAVVVSGCGVETVSLARGPRPYTESDYEHVYDRWTRSEDEFSWATMADVLRVSATFEAWEFRWAYVVRYCHDFSIDVTERDAMLRATLADSEQTHRFFVSLQGERFRESDLTGRMAAWRVLMVDAAGRQTQPTELQRVQRPSPAQQVYFRHITPHRAVFKIAFPVVRDDGSPTIPPGTTEVRLRFAGARGRVDLVWQLRADGTPTDYPTPETSGGEDSDSSWDEELGPVGRPPVVQPQPELEGIPR